MKSEPIEKISAKLSKGKKREKAILDCAIDVFIKYGYEGASIDKIIALSGGSRSTIYSAYGSKQGLFKAAVESMVSDVYSEYISNYDRQRKWEEELVVFGEFYLKAILSPTSIALTRMIFAEAPRSPDIGRWCYENGVVLAYVCFAKVLENHIDLPFERLRNIAMYYVEDLKANLYLRCLCDPSFHPSEKDIKSEVLACSTIFSKYIQSQITGKKC